MTLIIPGEVKRVRPRFFRQFGTAHLHVGDRLVRCHDLDPYQVTLSREVRCQRVTRKDGTPLGPWAMIVHNQYHRLPDGHPADEEENA